MRLSNGVFPDGTDAGVLKTFIKNGEICLSSITCLKCKKEVNNVLKQDFFHTIKVSKREAFINLYCSCGNTITAILTVKEYTDIYMKGKNLK